MQILKTDLQGALTNMRPVMVRAGVFSEEDYQNALKQMEAEVAEAGVTWPFYFVFGIKS
jgi:hypothetical protein